MWSLEPLAKLLQQWDHAAGCFDELAPSAFGSRAQTSSAETLGSKAVGAAAPHAPGTVGSLGKADAGELLRLHPAIVAN